MALGLTVFFGIYIFGGFAEPKAVAMAAVAALMAVWWITEAVPIAVTSLLPLVLFPLLGILDSGATAGEYFNDTIFLFFGGFLIAIAMQRSNLHKRIALMIIRGVGAGPNRIILGFMLASASLSMFISNTATAIMLLPIGLSVIIKMEESAGSAESHNFSVALMLAIAYSASAGGLATYVGTPPNLVFRHVYHDAFPGVPEITFAGWMAFGVPVSIAVLAMVWLFLTKILFRQSGDLFKLDKSLIRKEYQSLGAMKSEEKASAMAVVIASALWIFRKEINLGFASIPGWASALPSGEMIGDGTIAIVVAFALFLIPARNIGSGRGRLLDESAFSKIPWHIIILFGGGFALAEGFQSSGLDAVVGGAFRGIADYPEWLLIFLNCIGITFLTELTSNTAITQTILPILASVSQATGINPLTLMVPATLSASCAFMLPVATPPNAIVFGSGRLRIIEMARAGIMINIAGAALITLIFIVLGGLLPGKAF